MPFRCFSCGVSFNTAAEFTEHNLNHKKGLDTPDKKGPVCLKCGEPITFETKVVNFTGDIACPNCRNTMRVVIKNGELEIAISRENAQQEKGELMKQYRKAVLDYAHARDMIETLVPVPANLEIREEMPLFAIDDDMMARFYYATSTIAAALKKRQELHDMILKLPKER